MPGLVNRDVPAPHERIPANRIRKIVTYERSESA